jgi:GMP synthase-like glutamine amidotransferase
MPKRVLAIQNAECETLGNFEYLLDADGFEIKVIQASSEAIPSDPTAYSAIMILGGPMSANDNLPYLKKEMKLVNSAISQNIPTLGVCLGSQLIAQAAGGRVYPAKVKEIGWDRVRLTLGGKVGLLEGIEDPLDVFQWHGDTYDLPQSAEVLAYSRRYIQAFHIGSAFGIQFHVEVDRHLIESWISEYSSEITSEKLDPKKILGNPQLIEKLSHTCKQVYRNFMRYATKSKSTGNVASQLDF